MTAVPAATTRFPEGLDVAYTCDSSCRILRRTSGTLVTKFEWDGWDCMRETTGSSVTGWTDTRGKNGPELHIDQNLRVDELSSTKLCM